MKKEQDKTKKNEGLYIEMRHAKLSTSSMKRSKCCVSADDCDATGHTLTWHIGVVESVDNERAIVSKLIQKYIKRKANWMHPKLHFIHLKIHFTRPKTKLL